MATIKAPGAAHVRRMRLWFGDRRWRVASELTFENLDMIVREGEFWVRDGKVFRTPFGNKGVHGYILQEIDSLSGADVWKAGKPVRAAFGWVTISKASQEFSTAIWTKHPETGELVAAAPPRPYGKAVPS